MKSKKEYMEELIDALDNIGHLCVDARYLLYDNKIEDIDVFNVKIESIENWCKDIRRKMKKL